MERPHLTITVNSQKWQTAQTPRSSRSRLKRAESNAGRQVQPDSLFAPQNLSRQLQSVCDCSQQSMQCSLFWLSITSVPSIPLHPKSGVCQTLVAAKGRCCSFRQPDPDTPCTTTRHSTLDTRHSAPETRDW